MIGTTDSLVALAVLAAIVGPALTYYAAKRQHSGRIETTSAEALWQEGKDIRDHLTKVTNDQEAHITKLETSVSLLSTELAAAREEIRQLQATVLSSKTLSDALTAQVLTLQEELRQVRQDLSASQQTVAQQATQISQLLQTLGSAKDTLNGTP